MNEKIAKIWFEGAGFRRGPEGPVSPKKQSLRKEQLNVLTRGTGWSGGRRCTVDFNLSLGGFSSDYAQAPVNIAY